MIRCKICSHSIEMDASGLFWKEQVYSAYVGGLVHAQCKRGEDWAVDEQFVFDIRLVHSFLRASNAGREETDALARLAQFRPKT